jgi:hypothetical protein
MQEELHGFEVYGNRYERKEDTVAVLLQCFNELNTVTNPDHPGINNVSGKFICKRQGDNVLLEYHLMELHLDDPTRCESFVKECDSAVKKMAKKLKSAFKKATKSALTLKDNNKSGWHREQVSLNGRWYLRVWRNYSVSPSVTEDE